MIRLGERDQVEDGDLEYAISSMMAEVSHEWKIGMSWNLAR